MSLSLATRVIVRNQTAVRARSFHASTIARSVHGDYHHLPFQFPGQKKGIFAVKLVAYMMAGFSIPFLASAYQLKKAA